MEPIQNSKWARQNTWKDEREKGPVKANERVTGFQLKVDSPTMKDDYIEIQSLIKWGPR